MPRRLLALANPLAEAFTDSHGIVHPIRKSPGYDERIVRERARQRAATGLTAADQQLGRRFERWIAREQARQEREERRRRWREERSRSVEERLADLQAARDGLAEAIRDSGVADLVDLIGEHGARASRGLIPMGTARRLLPRPPEHYTSAIVRHAGRPYLRWEFAIDELAADRGYGSAQELRDAIEQVRRDERRLARIEAEIRHLERQARRRRNPSLLERLRRWLRGG